MNSVTARGKIQVVDYDRAWPDRFSRLREKIWPVVCDIAVGVEYVGSTAVPGMAAKPVIDLDIVIPSQHDLPKMVMRLAGLGYRHLGDLGNPGQRGICDAGESIGSQSLRLPA